MLRLSTGKNEALLAHRCHDLATRDVAIAEFDQLVTSDELRTDPYACAQHLERSELRIGSAKQPQNPIQHAPGV